MKKFTYILAILLAANSLFAQITMFQRTYGGFFDDFGRSAQQTFDGGYIVAGATSSYGAGNTDVYLFKTDSNGNMLWYKTFGGTNVDWGYSIEQTADTGYIIAGYTNSFGAGGYDVYLIKTDSLGNLTWQKEFGGSNWDFGYSVRQTYDGGYIVAGGSYSSGNGDEDFYLVKTNSLGTLVWDTTYGGINEDEARSVWQNATDSTYIVSGYTKSFGAGNSDFYYLRIKQNGDTLWTKTLGGIDEEKSYTVQQTMIDGGFILGGYTKSFGVSGSNDFYLVKTTALGDTIWTHKVGAWDNEIGYAATVNSLSQYAIVGLTEGPGYHHVFFEKTNPGGFWINSTSHGTTGEDAYSINTTSNGGFIICGETSSMGVSPMEVYLIKTDADGFTAPYNNIFEILPLNNIAQIQAYPNPFSDATTIEIPADVFNESKDLIFVIYDMAGREISFAPVSKRFFRVERGNLEQGIYLFRIISKTNLQLLGSGKVIIE